MHTIEDKDVVFFTTTLLTQFYVRFDISLHSFRGEVCAHKTSLTPLLIVEMPDQTQENEL